MYDSRFYSFRLNTSLVREMYCIIVRGISRTHIYICIHSSCHLDTCRYNYTDTPTTSNIIPRLTMQELQNARMQGWKSKVNALLSFLFFPFHNGGSDVPLVLTVSTHPVFRVTVIISFGGAHAHGILLLFCGL